MEKPFFIKQTIHNACGTMALLHAVTNTGSKIGGFTENSFLDVFTKTMSKASAEERARFLEDSKELEEIHYKFAQFG